MEWPTEFWMTLLDHAPSPIVVFQTGGLLILANKEAASQLGLESQEGQNLPEYLFPLLKASRNLLNYAYGRETTVTTLNGVTLHFLVKNLPGYQSEGIHVAFGLEKFSQPKPVSEPTDALKDSAVMADAVSQKVKGPLAGIELCASILGEELNEAGEQSLADLIEEIRYNVREVNEYLTSFESMAMPLDLELRPLNLAEVVDEALTALKEVFKAKGVGVLVDQKDVVVEADRGLMVQVFLNLFLNAAEAMPRGGRLHVDFRLNRKGQVEVVVIDTGPGIALKDMKRIFNPFFTTKNQPLGLGLPVSLRIMEAHQGQLLLGTNGDFGGRAVVVMPSIPDPSLGRSERTIN
jgi:signal transduction histidine kinase